MVVCSSIVCCVMCLGLLCFLNLKKFDGFEKGEQPIRLIHSNLLRLQKVIPLEFVEEKDCFCEKSSLQISVGGSTR